MPHPPFRFIGLDGPQLRVPYGCIVDKTLPLRERDALTAVLIKEVTPPDDPLSRIFWHLLIRHMGAWN